MRIGWIRLHYVAAYAILGAVLPYVSVYAEQRGLNDRQVGWVFGIFGLSVLIAPPIYTALADRVLSNRALIRFCYGVAALTLVALTLSTSFTLILLAHLAFALAFTALIPLLDGLTFATIGTPPTPPSGSDPARAGQGGRAGRAIPYRAVRIFGSYGWMIPGVGLAALALGGFSPITIATAAMLAGAGFCGIGLLMTVGLPVHGQRTAARGLPTLQAVRALRRPEVAAFVLALFLLFLSISIYYAFYSPYLNRLGVDSAWFGMITNLGVVVEIALMLASGWLMRRLGVAGLMAFGAAATVARMALLAAWPSTTVAIASQLFHGPAVLALYLIPPMYLNHKADPSFRNSIQGLNAMLCFGVARLVGSASGGYISEQFRGADPLRGLQAAYAVSAALALVSVIVLAFAFRDRETSLALSHHRAEPAERPSAAG